MSMIDHPLVQLTIARFRMFFREPSAVFWTFGFPILMTVVLGVAFRDKAPEPVYAAIVRGQGDAQLSTALTSSRDVKFELLDAPEAAKALRTGRVAIAIVPAHDGQPRTYQFDSARPESRLARALVDDALQRADGRKDPTPITDQHVQERGSRYVDFLVPGLLGMSLMSSGMWGIGYVLVEMRTRKLIKRMLATPMRRVHFLLSFVFMRLLFLLIEVPFMLIFARLAFGVQMAGSYALFGALTVAGGFAFSGLGLLVASRAQNTQTVGGLMNLVMMPMFMCSGVFFSTAHFPAAMQPIIKALPLTALNDALRAVLNEGAGVSVVAMPLAILSAWTICTIGVALRIFRWTT